MANILFEYLYRDASNWKQYGQAVFPNVGEIPLAEIEKRIRASLYDGEWFKAEMVDLETLFFGNHDTDDDHPWHEFWQVSETDLSPSDPSWGGPRRDIAYFLEGMEQEKLRRWDTTRRLCSICGQLFTDKDWENRHDLHEPDCPRVHALQSQSPIDHDITCKCDLVVHDRCCPVCYHQQPHDETLSPGVCVCCGHDNDGGYYGDVLPVCAKCYFDGTLGKWLALHGQHVPEA